ncbi:MULTISPECIES: DUF305 domain-containing protein [unclassified Pseudonocardia]|uniref:DUF305 domain-containing protein n=1 Tax=unclassified Pseudonocardia TaxID=2619320 RepID=UPI000969767D|nr:MULTISPECIES: DUF305 domain-containing protein [unclassified Pseudonocardia]MBN9097999.1 DUF305 domain-containing protein [Pseudonocardia sp.]OJY54402.1 MAG: hypothetical protein BGP03_22965 [Pseudonocardia sp. 73-21]
MSTPSPSAVDVGSGPVGFWARSPRWSRWVIAVGTALTLLLVGATAGLLIERDLSADPIPAADSVDVGFAQDMSVHHENAVQMAGWVRDHTADPAVRQLAYDIESGQTAQVGQMQGWLGLWGAATQSTGGYMTWMADMNAAMGMGHGSDGAAAMPGMASQADLARLRATTGTAADVLFLQLMLRHHEGGAGMLRYAADRATMPQVRNLAAQMLSAQTAESRLMAQMLVQRGAGPLDG